METSTLDALEIAWSTVIVRNRRPADEPPLEGLVLTCSPVAAPVAVDTESQRHSDAGVTARTARSRLNR